MTPPAAARRETMVVTANGTTSRFSIEHMFVACSRIVARVCMCVCTHHARVCMCARTHHARVCMCISVRVSSRFLHARTPCVRAFACYCVRDEKGDAMNTDAHEHDTTRDALRDLGRAGYLPLGHGRAIAYAWHAEPRHYHLTDTRSNTRIPTHGRVRLRWRFNASQRGTDKTVRVGTYSDSHNPRVRALA